MQKTYTGVLRDAYLAPKRRIFAYGKMIDFIDGSARGLSDSIARELLRRKILKQIIPEYVLEDVDASEAFLTPETGFPHTTFYEPESVEVAQPDFTELELAAMGDTEPEDDETVELEFEVVEDETYAAEVPVVEVEITKELIEGLYEELGTWTAVASHLGITTTRLKKYRDEFGI